MPEMPEVETIKNALERYIGKAKIEDIIVRNGHLRRFVPGDIKQRLCGAFIRGYRRRAKYILIDLSNALSIIWHMGMSGKVLICDQAPEPPDKHDHILVRTSAGWMIYNDARRFGFFTYAETDCLDRLSPFDNMGPEPFDNTFDDAYLFSKFQQKKIPVKAALLDQRIVTGIGNIYASEALFRAGISPLRPAENISRPECKKLVAAVRETLQKAIDAGGSSLRDYKKPDGSLGYFQNLHCVYNKTGQKCPQCTCDVLKTGGIKKTIIAGRSSFYCPQKQK